MTLRTYRLNDDFVATRQTDFANSFLIGSRHRINDLLLSLGNIRYIREFCYGSEYLNPYSTYNSFGTDDRTVGSLSDKAAALEQDVAVVAPETALKEVAGAPNDETLQVPDRIEQCGFSREWIASCPPTDYPGLRDPVEKRNCK